MSTFIRRNTPMRNNTPMRYNTSTRHSTPVRHNTFTRHRTFAWEISFAVSFLMPLLIHGAVLAVDLYATAGRANLQSATLENVMLLQNMRDTDYYCPRLQGWLIGYGAGGYVSGPDEIRDEGVPATVEDHFYESFAGFLAGADRQVRDDLRLGGFFSYNNTRLVDNTDADNGVANMNNFFWGMYGRKNFGTNTYVLGTLAGGYSHLKATEIPIGNRNYGNSENAWRAFVYGEVGKEYRFYKTTLQPFYGLQYFYNDYGSGTFFDDQASAYTSSPLKTNSLRNVLGIRLAQQLLKTEQTSLRLDCLAFWYHEFLNRTAQGNVVIYDGTGKETFAATGAYAGRDWVILAPALELVIG